MERFKIITAVHLILIKNRPEIELIEMEGMNYHMEIEELEIVTNKMIEKIKVEI